MDYGDMGRYGARVKIVEEPKKTKKKTTKQLANSKGSSRTVGIKHTVFRYAQIRRALDIIAQGARTANNVAQGIKVDKVNPSNRPMSWSKPAVLMIGTALEQKLTKLLKSAHGITSFAGKSTVSVAAVERAAENDGVPVQVFRGDCRESQDAAEIAGQMKPGRLRPRPEGEAQEEKLSRSKATANAKKIFSQYLKAGTARVKKAKYNACLDEDFAHSLKDPGFDAVSTMVSKASVKSMLTAVGAHRGSIVRIQMTLANIAYGFLHNIVRNIVSVLELYNALRVTSTIVQPILQDFGYVSVGFSAIGDIAHQKYIKNKVEEEEELP